MVSYNGGLVYCANALRKRQLNVLEMQITKWMIHTFHYSTWTALLFGLVRHTGMIVNYVVHTYMYSIV